jgi:hypothetical protein
LRVAESEPALHSQFNFFPLVDSGHLLVLSREFPDHRLKTWMTPLYAKKAVEATGTPIEFSARKLYQNWLEPSRTRYCLWCCIKIALEAAKNLSSMSAAEHPCQIEHVVDKHPAHRQEVCA